MAEQDLERLIGKAVLYPEFREKLMADPDKVIEEEGFELTEEQIASLKALDPEAVKAALQEVDAVTPRDTWN